MKKALNTVALCALLAAPAAHAMTGNEFTELCTEPMSSSFSCESYIAGFLSGMIAQSDADNAAPAVCLREGYSFKQLADIALRYIDAHPKKRDQDIEMLVVEAWQDWNPC